MGYIIALWCGGACKNNGGYNPSKPVVGGAGVYYPRGSSTKRARKHQYKPFAANINQGNITATNNRAELYGLIMALETALKVIDGFYSPEPYARVYINMDSRYVVDGMMTWRFKWENNGWRTNKGGPVANQDLFEKAIRLKDSIECHGKVTCHWAPKGERHVAVADALANQGSEDALETFNARSRFYSYDSD